MTHRTQSSLVGNAPCGYINPFSLLEEIASPVRSDPLKNASCVENGRRVTATPHCNFVVVFIGG